ncbi:MULTISPECIES: hypothetical protein [Bacillales]|uniref:Uncharacterized protein n=1 Tax=Caldibacillus debilis TaxID=301148 RepID=A0A150MA41_9BACI|nr:MULTISPECIES: hypothetical protein [Bacillaceae]KYD21378.1 hypothetical protein B4135_1658 [Caldibacillus debilis]
MEESLSSFMIIFAVVIIVISLLFGIAFTALQEKNDHHEDVLQTEHQIQFKP